MHVSPALITPSTRRILLVKLRILECVVASCISKIHVTCSIGSIERYTQFAEGYKRIHVCTGSSCNSELMKTLSQSVLIPPNYDVTASSSVGVLYPFTCAIPHSCTLWLQCMSLHTRFYAMFIALRTKCARMHTYVLTLRWWYLSPDRVRFACSRHAAAGRQLAVGAVGRRTGRLQAARQE